MTLGGMLRRHRHRAGGTPVGLEAPGPCSPTGEWCWLQNFSAPTTGFSLQQKSLHFLPNMEAQNCPFLRSVTVMTSPWPHSVTEASPAFVGWGGDNPILLMGVTAPTHRWKNYSWPSLQTVSHKPQAWKPQQHRRSQEKEKKGWSGFNAFTCQHTPFSWPGLFNQRKIEEKEQNGRCSDDCAFLESSLHHSISLGFFF